MKKKRPPADPEIIRFSNGMAKAVSGFTITNLSEADIRELFDGKVPAWIHDTVAWWLRDNPKAGEVNPAYKTHGQEAAEAERKSA